MSVTVGNMLLPSECALVGSA
uniref:Uncharacterized protein n=1 Tax=Anguilla anguilla TaxID=7936 RepID=A0A0E9TX58_ANGAN